MSLVAEGRVAPTHPERARAVRSRFVTKHERDPGVKRSRASAGLGFSGWVVASGFEICAKKFIATVDAASRVESSSRGVVVLNF